MDKLEKLKKDTLGFPDRAKRIIVHDGKTLTLANDFLQAIKLLMQEIANTFNPIIKKAHEAHKEAVSQKKRYEFPLIEAERTIKLHIGSYMEEQERIQREIEEKARKEEEERQAKEDLLLERAKVYEKAGQTEEADAILEEIPLPAKVEIPPAPEPEGLVVKHILDTERINNLVTATKGRTRIPGIEIYPVWFWKITDRKLIPKSYYKSSVSTRTAKTENVTHGKPEDA